MSKQIIFSQKARQEFQAGLDALANAVKVTLGPRGRNVAIERNWGPPTVTKDGVTVAEHIELESHSQNMGAALVKEVAQRTNEDVGDGTTTATVLAQALYGQGMKLVAAGVAASELKRGIDKAEVVAQEALKKQATQAKTREDSLKIATISANGDTQIGTFLADAFDKIGKDGVVTVQESQAMESTVEIVEGMEFDRGYISPYFITDQKRLRVELKDPYILVSEKKISAIAEILPLLEAVKGANGQLLIIAEDVEGEALAALTLNKLRGVLQSAAVKAPGFGERRKEILKDIAALIGATPFMQDIGRKLDQANLSDLGSASSVMIDKEKTQLVKGAGSKEAIKGRINQIIRAVEETNSTYDKEKLQERLSRLSGGVAVLRVGGATDVEVRERKHRVEDALAATRAALQKGFVPGGGVALLRAAAAIDGLAETLDAGEREGALLLKRALQAPLDQIALNAGEEPAIVRDRVLQGKGAFGFDARALEYCDLVKAGVIDPLLVASEALNNAVSVASLMLMTEALIHNKPEAKKAGSKGGAPSGAAGGMPGMGGMGMGGMGMGGMGMGGMGGMGMGDDFDM